MASIQNSSGIENRVPAAAFFSAHPSIKLVRLLWIDYSGVLRCRTVTKAVALDIASGSIRYSLAQNCMIIPVSTAPACFPDGIEEWNLQPDWDSLVECGFRSSHAMVYCYTAHMGLDESLERCPRNLLAKAVNTLHDRHGMQALIGFEIEFVFLDDTLNMAISSDHTVGYSMTAGLRTKNLDIIEEIVAALETSGIEIYHFHVELDGQFEIALMPLSPLRAVDALMTAKETIKTITLTHGLRASLAPKPIIRGPRNGLHAHLSLSPGAADEAGDFFLAGLLAKLTPLCALGLANFDSYERVAGDCAGEWVGFGTGNKDLPIRKVHSRRWELRAIDATANMYLFLAAAIYAGAAGIESGIELPSRDCSVVPSAFSFEDARDQLREFGVTKTMPKSLGQSLSALKDDEDVVAWIGRGLLTKYISVKEKEVEHFGTMHESNRRVKFLQYF